jgi:hypothetical protein
VALASGGTEPPPDGRTHLAVAASLLVRGALVALLGLWLEHRVVADEPERGDQLDGLGQRARRTDVAAGLLAGGTVLAVAAWAASALLLGPGGGAAALGPALERRRYGTTPTDTWWWLAVDSPHSGSPLDLAHTTGTALAVLGAMLLLTHPAGSASSSGCRPRVLAKVARQPVIVPAALGAAPLTLYTLHVIGLAAHPGNGTDDVALWVTHVLIATAIGALLWLAGHRGPLEAVVSAAGRGARWLVSPPAAPPEGRTPGTGPARTS